MSLLFTLLTRLGKTKNEEKQDDFASFWQSPPRKGKKKRIRRSWRVMLNNLNLSTLSENFKEKKTSTIF